MNLNEDMVFDERMLSQLKVHEGFDATMYKDTVDVWTIGYGTNLEVGLTEEEASVLLEMRLRELIRQLATFKAFNNMAMMTPARVAVLTNMVYNLGVRGLLKFENMWRAISIGEFGVAADEMLDSKWAGQVGHRAITLSEQMRTGKWKALD